GKRLIEQIMRQKLPAGFQTSEFMLDHGMIDMVVERNQLRATLSRLIRLYAGRREAMGPLMSDSSVFR
ncbi:MAG: acetyl-CoA carboxylase carboxyl transferase subunit beta, partial [Oscillochloris sp.]|nr:acetyl-CoA carboxylase carboxyl transferase subunit beta [Oscillochloris sp.]